MLQSWGAWRRVRLTLCAIMRKTCFVETWVASIFDHIAFAAFASWLHLGTMPWYLGLHLGTMPLNLGLHLGTMPLHLGLHLGTMPSHIE